MPPGSSQSNLEGCVSFEGFIFGLHCFLNPELTSRVLLREQIDEQLALSESIFFRSYFPDNVKHELRPRKCGVLKSSLFPWLCFFAL